jgi:hypothetical protein
MTEPIVKSKRINERKYPGIKGVRPDYKASRVLDAIARNKAYAGLPLEEKKRRNPKKFVEKVS